MLLTLCWLLKHQRTSDLDIELFGLETADWHVAENVAEQWHYFPPSLLQCSSVFIKPTSSSFPPPFSFTSGRKKHTFTLRYSCAGSFALRNNSNSVSKTEKMLTWNQNSKNCSGEVFIVHGPTTQPLLWLSNIPVWYFLYHNGNIALYIQM